MQSLRCVTAPARVAPSCTSGGSVKAAPQRRAVAAAGASNDASALKSLKKKAGSQVAQSADPQYVAASEYLAEVGLLNLAEKSRVLDIATNPNSLFLGRGKNSKARPLDVEADLRPVVEFLQSKGVTADGLVQIIVGYPPVLSGGVEPLIRFWGYLETEIGVQDVGSLIVERPNLLGLDVDNNLRKIVDYLRYVETPAETIIKYLERSI